MLEGFSLESLFSPVATLVTVGVAFGVMQARQQATGKAIDDIKGAFKTISEKLDTLDGDVTELKVSQAEVKQQIKDQSRRLESHTRELEARRMPRRDDR